MAESLPARLVCAGTYEEESRLVNSTHPRHFACPRRGQREGGRRQDHGGGEPGTRPAPGRRTRRTVRCRPAWAKYPADARHTTQTVGRQTAQYPLRPYRPPALYSTLGAFWSESDVPGTRPG